MRVVVVALFLMGIVAVLGASSPPKGKYFDRILIVMFENQVPHFPPASCLCISPSTK